MRKFALIPALLLAAACAETPAGPSATAGTSSSGDAAGMIATWGRLNQDCRGGSGSDPATQRACDQRDALYNRIEAAGFCYGENDTYGYEMKWAVCNRVR